MLCDCGLHVAVSELYDTCPLRSSGSGCVVESSLMPAFSQEEIKAGQPASRIVSSIPFFSYKEKGAAADAATGEPNFMSGTIVLAVGASNTEVADVASGMAQNDIGADNEVVRTAALDNGKANE